MKISDRKIIWLLIALQLLVCLPFITSFPIALDEPFSIFYAQQELGEFLPVLNAGNNSPLYFVLLHFWIELFGVSAISVRLMTLLISLLVIFVLYQLARSSLSKLMSTLVIVLFVFSRFFHYHSMEARMYMLFSLFFVLILSSLFKLKRGDKSNYILLAIYNALLFYTHYLSIFVFVTEIFFVIVCFTDFNKSIKHLFANVLLTLILCLPGGLVLIERLGSSSGISTWVPRPHWTELYGNIIRFFNNSLTFFIIIIFCLVWLVVFKVDLRKASSSIFRNKQVRAYFLIFLVPYSLMFGCSLFYQSVFLDRYLLFLGIPLFIFIAHMCSFFLVKNKEVYFLFVFVPLLFSVNFSPKMNRSVDLIAEELKSSVYKHATIYVSPPWIRTAILYHYDLKLFRNYTKVQDNMVLNPIYNLEEIGDHLNIAIVNSGEGYLKEGQIISFFEKKGYKSISHKVFNDLYSVNLFIKND